MLFRSTSMMEAVPSGTIYLVKPVRCHNRQTHKAKILRGGIRKRNQAPYTVFGFRLWDKVKFDGRECFVKGRRTSGYFALAVLEGAKVTDSASYKKLKFLETAKHYVSERRDGSPPTTVMK